jgi:hypothetical protein
MHWLSISINIVTRGKRGESATGGIEYKGMAYIGVGEIECEEWGGGRGDGSAATAYSSRFTDTEC